jgi:hypothetical protein
MNRKMAETVELQNEEELSLLSISDNGDRSWRLNFESFQLSSEHTEKTHKPSPGIHDCYGVLGNFTIFILFIFLPFFKFFS